MMSVSDFQAYHTLRGHTPAGKPPQTRQLPDVDVNQNQSLIQAIEARVAQIEEATSVDIVVTIVPHSGSYADVYLQAGSALALLVLIAIMATPRPVHEVGVVLDLAVAFAVGWFAARRSHAVVRALTSAERRRRQVLHSAAAAMHTAHVTETPERTGLLVHLSALEQDSVVLPDIGLEHRVPPATWTELEKALDAPLSTSHPQAAILAALDHVKQVLASACPATSAPHHLSNAPRVLES